MDFQKLPVTPQIGADWQTFKAITKDVEIDKEYRKLYRSTRLGSWAMSPLVAIENRLYRKIADKPLEIDPFFIIGHWRSGTTFVHSIFATDKHFGYNTTYQTVLPNLMLFWHPFFSWCLQKTMPHNRPADNMELGAKLPQEEEFALSNMMPYSYYNFWYFPKYMMDYCERFMLFNTITEEERQVFKDTFVKLIKKSLKVTGGNQFLSKNPPHTGRIRTLLEMFPNAKFLYLKRNPYTVFESTMNFFTNTMRPLKYQTFSDEDLEKNCVEVYRRLFYKYEQEKHLIPEGNLMELKFEDFEADPFSGTEEIYRQLNLPGFNEARADIEKYIGKKKGYKKNNYKYNEHTVSTVEQHWGMALKEWGYSL